MTGETGTGTGATGGAAAGTTTAAATTAGTSAAALMEAAAAPAHHRHRTDALAAREGGERAAVGARGRARRPQFLTTQTTPIARGRRDH